jgi:hypothetical protein
MRSNTMHGHDAELMLEICMQDWRWKELVGVLHDVVVLKFDQLGLMQYLDAGVVVCHGSSLAAVSAVQSIT